MPPSPRTSSDDQTPPVDDAPASRVDAKPAPAPAPGGQVKARFVDVQSVYSPTQGIICYGDAFMVTPEQLEQDPRFIAWDDKWQPDPVLLAVANYQEPEG